MTAPEQTGDTKVVMSSERLRRVIDVGVALNAELSLDELLRLIAENAAELTEARYAALGVIDPRGSDLERFITHGVDEETRRTIGELPRGRGILGALINDARQLRLDDLHADPRSVGFPPGHPPMTSFLGVPIFLRGVAYGNLYLTEKLGGRGFTEEDEQLATMLAAQAAVAIENARLYESSIRWARQLESLGEVSKALANEYEPDAVLAWSASESRSSSMHASSISQCRVGMGRWRSRPQPASAPTRRSGASSSAPDRKVPA